jgi:ketosteroid isomerase-like protein
MADYWKSNDLLFIGKSGVTYGWDNTLKNYKLRYPTSKEMGQLKFEIVELDRLGTDLFFMVGKWNLTREIGDISGHFSLIWKKIDGDWVIISDHSS